jgi:hypothetical protein
MSPNDEKLGRAFRAVADLDPREAPASVELALLAQFRKRKARRIQIRWAASIAAVFLVAVFIPRSKPVPPPAPRLAHIVVPEFPRVQVPVRSVAARRPRAARRQPGPAQPHDEIATRFYPLQDAATLSPFEYGTLVRIQLPRSALRVVGLPVNEDRLSERINADVLLGQDGLARAVRFVQ